MAMHEQQFSVERMCQVLGVSRSGYYAWRGRRASARQMANQALGEQIAAIHRRSRETYGSPRVYQELRAAGHACGVNRVARLMRQQGLVARQARLFRRPTRRSPHTALRPNLLATAPEPVSPDQVWLADITYIATREGWLYLACVMDRFSRRVIGWATSPTLAGRLTRQALHMALYQRHPRASLIHHSDRGSQYTATAYHALAERAHAQFSFSQAGNCWQNAHQESFFGTLKCELVYGQTFATRRQAQQAIFRYIEGFYNPHRRHSALGYLSPVAFEEAYEAQFH
jgi:transposase InsO family protein